MDKNQSDEQEDVNGRSRLKWSSDPPNHIFLDMMHWKVIYYTKSEVLDLESNLLFPWGGGGGVIYYTQLESNLLCEIRRA